VSGNFFGSLLFSDVVTKVTAKINAITINSRIIIRRIFIN